MELIQKAIDHNTKHVEIDVWEQAFFVLFNRMPELFVSGSFVELKTNDCVFAKTDKCEVLRQRATGKAIFAMFDIDGTPCKATIEDTDQCILILK